MDELNRRTLLRGTAMAGVAVPMAASQANAAAPKNTEPNTEPPKGGGAPNGDWTPERADRERVLAAGFTERKADAWLLLNRAGAALRALPRLHPSDETELPQDIHALQNRLMFRPAYRTYRSIAPQ
ncbi:hypothetical protein [Sciscionella marina]|uniref:hypothetical protein n=1 Tax=Sciscionella marina TaxID=508770 RepID=UPI0003742A8B|nr:hypothetical protein [Sciscionella marina]